MLGWQNLNTTLYTVDEMVAVGAVTVGLTPVSGSSSTPINGSAGGATGLASYWTATTNSRYDGTSGTFVLTSTTSTARRWTAARCTRCRRAATPWDR